MKLSLWKRSIALALTLVMCLTVFPANVLAANGPDPSPDGYPFLWLYDDDYRQITLYPERAVDAGLEDPGDAVVYDKATNTLTMNGFDGSAFNLEANTMGDDFVINVVGSNTLAGLTVYGAAYGGSLELTGDGTLTVNPDTTNYCGIQLCGEEADAVLTIGSDLTLTVFGKDAVEPAVVIYESGAAEAIVLPPNADGIQVEKTPLQLKATIGDNPDEYRPWFYIYTWEGGYYGAQETYMSATHSFYYSMYTLTGDPENGFTDYVVIPDEKNLAAVPEKYEPVYGKFSDFTLTDEAGDPLGVVSIQPGGEPGELIRPTLTISVEDGMAGAAFTGKLTAAPMNGGKITYKLVNAPDWLTLDAATGTLGGTPNKAGALPLVATATETVRGQSITSYPVAKTLRIDAPTVTLRLAQALTDGLDRTLTLTQGSDVLEVLLGTGDLAAGVLYETAQLTGGADCTATLTGALHGVSYTYGTETFTVPLGENLDLFLSGLAAPALRHAVPTVQNADGQPVEAGAYRLEWYDGADPSTAQLISRARDYVCLPTEAVWVRAVPENSLRSGYDVSPSVAVDSDAPVLTLGKVELADLTGTVTMENGGAPIRNAMVSVIVNGTRFATTCTDYRGGFTILDAPITEQTLLTVSEGLIETYTLPLTEAPTGPLEIVAKHCPGRIQLPYWVYALYAWAETPDGAQRIKLHMTGGNAFFPDTSALEPGQTYSVYAYGFDRYAAGSITLDEYLQATLELTDNGYLGKVRLSVENPDGLTCVGLLYNAEGERLRVNKLSYLQDYCESGLLEGDYTALFVGRRTYLVLGSNSFMTLEGAKELLDTYGTDLYTETTFHAETNTNWYQTTTGSVTAPTGILEMNRDFVADACSLKVEADDDIVTFRATVMPKATSKNTLLLELVTNQYSDDAGRVPDLVNGSLYLNGKRVDSADTGVSFYPNGHDHVSYFDGIYSLKIQNVKEYGGWPLTVQWQTYRTDFDRVTASLFGKHNSSSGESSYIATKTVETPALRLIAPTITGTDTFGVYGYAPKGAQVTILLDGAEANRVLADARNGFYTASVALNDPYGVQTHTVSVTSEKDGQTLRSGEVEVEYCSTVPYLSKISLYTYNNQRYTVWEDGAARSGFYYYMPGIARPYELEFANCDGPEALEKVVVHIPRTDGEEVLEAHWVSGGTWRTDPYLAGGDPPTGVWIEYVPAYPDYDLTENDLDALERAEAASRDDWDATVDELKAVLGDDSATEYTFASHSTTRDGGSGDPDQAAMELKIKWANGAQDIRELSFKMDGVRYTIRSDAQTNMSVTNSKNNEYKAMFEQFEGKTQEERLTLPLFSDWGDDVFYPFESDDTYQRVGMKDGVLTNIAISRAGTKDLDTVWRVTTMTPDKYTETVYNTRNASVATLVYERGTPFEIDLADYYDPVELEEGQEKQPWDNDVNRGLILQTLWFGAFYDMDAIAKGEQTGTWADLGERAMRADKQTLPSGVKLSGRPTTAFYQLMAACLLANGVENGMGQGSGRDAEVWMAFDVARKANGGGVYNNIKWKLGRELLGELKSTMDSSIANGKSLTNLLTEGSEKAIYNYVKKKIEKAYYTGYDSLVPTAKNKSSQKKIDEMGQVWDGVDAIFRELESRGYKIDRSLMPPDPRLTADKDRFKDDETSNKEPGGGGGGGSSGEPGSGEPGETEPGPTDPGGGGKTEPESSGPVNPPSPGATETPVPDSAKPVIDPSGYVYEGVPSNRVSGVTATIYEVEDDGSTALWDAEEYDQPNPYITDDNGFYEWMVPTGKWSVRFTADGYEPYVTGENDGVGTAKAGDTWYMPVAPAQLDVNINLQRLDAPEIVSAIPTAEGVRVVFSQYMRASTLTADMFSVLINSLQIAVSDVLLLDGEENDGELFAREVLIVCAPEESDLVSLTVDAAVESYTGQTLVKPFILTDAAVQTLPSAKAPQFTQNSGAAEIGSSVSIAADSGARIYYTTDGTEPTRKSALYTGPILIMGDVTIRAIAVETGKRDSAAAEASFTTEETYPITILTDGHGTARVDKVRAEAGETVTLTAEPFGGYELSSVTLRPQGTRVTAGSFTMPAGEVTVVVKFRDTITSSACTHEHTGTEHKDPTCTEPGYDVVTCDDCGTVLSETEIAALGHDLVTDAAVAPTCTEPGLTAGEHCTRCDYKIAQETVAALGHDWGAPVYLWTADYGSVTATHTCLRDASHTETETVNTTSKVTKEATYEEEGEIVYTATFTNPAFPTVTKAVATPKLEKPTPTNPFNDVFEKDYFYEPVLWAVANGITKGTSDTTFSPYDTCTRGQVVTFLWRAKGCPEPTNTENPFTDIKPNDYFYTAVLWAKENGITTGTSGTTFSPDDGCTRAQVVTFLWRTEGEPKPTSSKNPFRDVSGGYYYDAVLWAVEKGITKGTTDTTFSPDDTCTRGQIVTFLYRDLA